MILLRNILITACLVGVVQGTTTAAAVAQTSDSTAPAPTPPSAVILKPASVSDLRDLAEATGRLIRVEVDRVGLVRTEGTPALYLDDLQMALGCLGETPHCLGVVAAELNVQTLVYASLERAGSRLSLTLVYFDGTESHLATRSVSAPAPDNTLLETVEPLVREVFGLPPLPPAAVTRVAVPAHDVGRQSRGLRAGAFVAAGVAAAAVGASAFFLHDHQRAERRYRDAPAETTAQVNDALRSRSRAESSGRAGMTMVGLAGAASVSAVVLGVLVHVRHPRDEARVQASVVVGRGQLGVAVGGSL